MSNEFQHKSVGSQMTQTEYEHTDGTGHIFDSQATGDIPYADSSTVIKRLGIGSSGQVLEVSSGKPAWTAAITGATSILNTSLVIGRDADNDIDFATDNNIIFRAAGADQIKLIDGALAPVTDNDVDLGTSSLEFKDAFFDGTVTSDAFAGPLTGDVTGDVTGNADTATALATGRTIGMTGDVVWTSASFTGAGNVTGSSTIQADAVESGMLNDNIISGQTEITSGLADADELLYSDGGVLKRVGLDTLSTKILTGNAASATILATARAINGVDFDGSAAITVTAAGSTLSDTVPVSKGGTNATSLADKAVLITQDSGTDTVAAAAMSTNGQLLIGGTSGPAVATLTAGTGISISNSDGGITVTNSSPSAATALDDIAVGDSASTLATSAGDITIDAQGNDTDIIFKGTDGSADTTFLTLDGSDAGKALFNADVQVGNDLFLNTDSSVINMGAGNDVTFTHDGTTGLTIAANPITLDSGADITFDAAGNDFSFQSGGTEVLKITNSASDVIIKPVVDEKDIIFQQRDGTEVARVEDNGTFNIVTDKLAINGTAVTSTAAELNLLDGGTSVGGSITVVDADGFVVNDGGTMKTIPASDVKTYAGGGSGGAYSLVSSTNFGASSTMTHAFSNVFTEENANYRIYLQMGQYNQSGTPFPYLRLYTDTGTTEGSTVRYHGRSVGSGGVSTETNLGTGNSTGASGDEWSMIVATDTNAGVIQGDDFPAYHAVIDIFNARHTTGTSQTTNRDRVTSISCHGGYMDMAGYFKQFSFELHMDEAQELFGFGIHTSKYYPDSDGALGTNLHGSNNPTEGMAGQFDLYKISVT